MAGRASTVNLKLPVPCQVCNKEISKYRCSKCETRYCSVACYKTHKEESNSEGKFLCNGKRKRADSRESNANISVPVLENKADVFDDKELKLSEDQKKLLGSCDWLKSKLQDPKLQTVLRKIDESTDREAELQFHRKNPEFASFIDTMLRNLGILRNGRDGLEFNSESL